MARFGWISDTHVNPDADINADAPAPVSLPGPEEDFTEDITSLFEDHGAQHLFFNGDLVCKAESFYDGRYEHSTPEYYDRFWELVDNSGHGDKVVTVPGNHDVPLQYYLESDERAHLRYKKEYEDDGVTVLMVNTAGTGWVSGSPEKGYGWSNGYVPRKDLLWLDEELSAAGDNTKVVYFHHHAYMTPGDPKASAATDTMSTQELYWTCRNYSAIHDVLQKYDKVICPQGHTNHYSAEGSSNVDGVEYLFKKHYYHVYNDEVTTFAYIDADDSGVEVTSVEHDSGATNVILEKDW